MQIKENYAQIHPVSQFISFTVYQLCSRQCFRKFLIEGLKFLDDVPEVEGYREDGSTLIIG